jgi:predicted transcriptional regulator
MATYIRPYHDIQCVATTIQLSEEMKKTLQSMKLHPRETYEEVLERLLEDLRELNEETKKEIEKAIREIKAGKYKTHEQLKAEMGF